MVKETELVSKNLAPEDNYPSAVGKYPPTRSSTERILPRYPEYTGTPPSKGYEHIVELMAQKLVRTVLTTTLIQFCGTCAKRTLAFATSMLSKQSLTIRNSQRVRNIHKISICTALLNITRTKPD